MAYLALLPPLLSAQGVTTGTMRGTVVAADGSPVDGTEIRVLHTGTGYTVATEVRHGRFLVRGLEVGGPYRVSAARLGFHAVRQDGVVVQLGEPVDLSFILRPEALAGDTLIAAASVSGRIDVHGGTATTIPGSLVHRLPTLDRNVYDFVRLAPHVSTNVGHQRSGVSAAGANLRFNTFLIDGAEERFVNGNVSAAQSIGKSIPIGAVREYQVMVAPYDVRYGDFAGALVNTVTMSGSNELQGTAFAVWRNDRLARAAGDGARYDRWQVGFTLGGPIVRDRVSFFLAPEFQRLTAPAPGTFLGSSDADTQAPVRESDIRRLDDIMRGFGLRSGSAGPVELSHPLRNLFVRVDAAMPRWRSRAAASLTYAAAENATFSRSARDTFSLSSYRFRAATGVRTTSLRVITDFARVGGAHNELVVSHSSDWNDFLPDVRQPLVRVLVQGTGGGLVTVNAGTAESAQGRFGRAWSVRIRDDLSLPLGPSHLLRFGVQAERFSTTRGGVAGGYGVWTFASLDAFEAGAASRYDLRRSMGSDATTLRGGQYAVWAGDEWRPADRLTITMGIRADLLDLDDRAAYNAAVDSVFGRRTDRMPRARIHVSPRLGFAWDLSEAGRDRVRGGVGLFTGRPPLAWLVPALASYGDGIGHLRCGLIPAGSPPPFEPDYRAAPTACATGQPLAAAPLGDVDLLDRGLRMAQVLRTSVAYDRELPWDLRATAEVLISRHLSDFRFANLNLSGPQAVDRNGRTLYGTIAANGLASPALRSGFAEVIDLTNTAKNRSYQVSGRVERQFAEGVAAIASYTYSRVRDVQSPSRVNARGIALWADAAAVSHRHDESRLGVSLNDLPHRAVVALTYRAPWQRAATELSFYYVGESGSPFTYLAGGAGGRGDLNADGSNTNDPVYVPRDAFDSSEILFDGTAPPGGDDSDAARDARVRAQQVAFERFIEASTCLRRQRGRVLERNACREPWSHTTVASLRQTIPIGGRGLETVLDVVNVLDLLNDRWGRQRVAVPRLLEHVAQTTGSPAMAQPIFRFDPAHVGWTTLETGSAFQLQLTARYRF